uniref:Uncharacterized protein n=1 Tax=Sphaerodactylus townsendi TaxID=933632 RepID=A0ACB8FZ61_9SAUR
MLLPCCRAGGLRRTTPRSSRTTLQNGIAAVQAKEELEAYLKTQLFCDLDEDATRDEERDLECLRAEQGLQAVAAAQQQVALGATDQQQAGYSTEDEAALDYEAHATSVPATCMEQVQFDAAFNHQLQEIREWSIQELGEFRLLKVFTLGICSAGRQPTDAVCEQCEVMKDISDVAVERHTSEPLVDTRCPFPSEQSPIRSTFQIPEKLTLSTLEVTVWQPGTPRSLRDPCQLYGEAFN